jgi:hypothetical protein
MPARTDQLIKSVRQMCEIRGIRNVDIARSIGISPQSVWNILNGTSQATGEQALALEELLLKDQSMKSELVDPPKMPRESTRDPSIPRTLSSALEKIDLLQSRIKQLEQPQHRATAPIAPANVHGVPPQGNVKITAPKTRLAQLQAQSTEMPRGTGLVFNEPQLTAIQATSITPPGFKRICPDPMPMMAPPVVKKLLPASANTPYLIGEILKVTNFEDLTSMLGNPAHSKLQKACIYSEVQSRRAVASDPK